MNRHHVTLLMAIAISLAVILLPAIAQSQLPPKWNDPDTVSGELLVKYTPDRTLQILQTGQSGVNGLIVTRLEDSLRDNYVPPNPGDTFIMLLPRTFLGTFDPAQRDPIVQQLLNDPEAVYVEPNVYLYTTMGWGVSTPDDPGFSDQWGMSRIMADSVWPDLGAEVAEVIVAICEGRFDMDHRDLVNQAVDLGLSDRPVQDHATHVAGIVAATGNNGLDVAGVANVKITMMGPGSHGAEFATQLSAAVNAGVDVVNISGAWQELDSSTSSDCEYAPSKKTAAEAIWSAHNYMVLVAAAMNASCDVDADGDLPYPAAYDGVIGVSALQELKDSITSFSNFGDYIDVIAPGQWIRSTSMDLGDSTAVHSGTSQATPHVAGAAAAILTLAPNFRPYAVEHLLELTAEDIMVPGYDQWSGHGVVNVKRARDALADVYVWSKPECDNIYEGSLEYPKCNLAAAVADVPEGGIIGIVARGTVNEAVTISKPCRLISVGGTAIIGK